MAEPTDHHFVGVDKMVAAPETDAIEAIRKALEVASKQLPQPACTYADHSYPAFSKRQMEEHAFSVASALLRQLEEAPRDAARYRWLRDSSDATWRPFGIRGGFSAAQADAVIDSAILVQQGGEHGSV